MGYPLAGIRVLAMEQAVAAPLATRHLADLGADVIKVERPEGDFARRYDTAVKGQSSYFVWLNRGKRSITMDWRKPQDREALEKLVERSDVLVHNLGPGAMERLGLGTKELNEKYPRLIHCGVSGYGKGGPYETKKAFDLLLQGETGAIALTGTPDEPAKVGFSIADISAGLYAFSSILAALIERGKTGRGGPIDIAMFDTMIEWTAPQCYIYAYTGEQLPRVGWRHNMIVPYGPYKCAGDKHVNLAVQNEGQWERFCSVVLERPDLAVHPLFKTNESRVKNRGELEPMIEAILGKLEESSVIERLERGDVPYGRINDLKAVVEHPQLEGRNRWSEYPSEAGPLRMWKHPMNIDGMPQREGAVPALGEHSQEILREIGM